MRKYQQKQLLELMKTLGEAHAEIKRLFSAGETQALIGLLSDCQESAVQIGEFIEQLEGEGTKTVHYLEEYCELLYQISVAANDPENGTVFCNQLQGQLTRIENSLRDDLEPNRIEMVFLPYKVSMWDSMESVWLAAKDDPRCDAYVVPIPYYDRLPDGKLGQMHYEGGQYPDYVPIVDWRKYNIEERRPDIIVNHNPYDGWNHVTSVHPDFYSKRLKNLTDLLVYIPYFVCVDDVQARFCVCNAVLYADKVIVQSEKIRKTYLREFRKMEEENNCKGLFGNAESKFVVLGSPKFDKVISTKREDCQIPVRWRELIERADGTRKKIVLYNTSITELLEGNKKVLHKLRYVFHCFKDREDSVLLWRPHPLNLAAYESMRPQLAKEYRDIVSEYKSQGFGIYDDTADLNRAIAVSDAYYGDWSSLVALYQCTGKPVMIQNPDIVTESKGPSAPAFENLYDDGEHLWFTAYNFNALFKMDKQTWKAEYVGSFPGEKADGFRLYGSIAAYGGKLYFAPLSAHEIAEYDIGSKTFRKIKIFEPKEKSKTRYWPEYKFCTAIQHKNYVFFVACSYPAFIRYDIAADRLDYFSDWNDPLNRLVTDYEDVYFWHNAAIVGSCFYVAACNANAVVAFNMDTLVSTVYEVGSKRCRYSDICFDGIDYWLTPRHDGPIIKWNFQSNRYMEYESFPNGYSGGKNSFNDIKYFDGHIWIFPFKANMALKINVQRGDISVAEEFQKECTNSTESQIIDGNYIFAEEIGDVIYAHTGKSNHLIKYDYKSGCYCEGPVFTNEEFMAKIWKQIFTKDIFHCKRENDCYYYEDAISTINGFLNYIVQYSESENAKMLHDRQIEIFKGANEETEGTSGEAIFSYCKQMLIR